MSGTLGRIKAETDHQVVCHCRRVTKSEILDTIIECGGCLNQVSELTGAGTVCGGCTPAINQILGIETLRPARLVSKIRLDDCYWSLQFRLSESSPALLPACDVALECRIGSSFHTRSYTLTRASRSTLEITVRREALGLVSRWLCDDANLDSEFRISVPFGGLEYGKLDRPVFLAAGIGITPALGLALARPDLNARIFWWVRGSQASGLIDYVRRCVADTASTIEIYDTSKGDFSLRDEAQDWLRAHVTPQQDVPHICGPHGFMETALQAFSSLEWHEERIRLASFVYAPGGLLKKEEKSLHRIEEFKIPEEATVAPSFHLRPAEGFLTKQREARSFLKQFYHEVGAERPFSERFLEVTKELRRTGTYTHTLDELAYGSRLAWRNSNRCIGRFFWQSLTVRDRRNLSEDLSGWALAKAVFDELVEHLRFGTNGGDLRPSITVFPADRRVFIENGQIILYAGHEQSDGSVIGDPKNVDLTNLATSLGWKGSGTPFDVLPVMITIDSQETYCFDLPNEAVLEVELCHPEIETISQLGLKWFAVPAVANMALDIGGVVYGAAPSNGFYMGTEIGSFNLGDPRRYNLLPKLAEAMGLSCDDDNPLWRDQAMVELNRAVIYSFKNAGVRMLDHHALSAWFERFRKDETRLGRPVFGHWPWIVPPMSANLSEVWHDPSLKNVILKPGYFYQSQCT